MTDCILDETVSMPNIFNLTIQSRKNQVSFLEKYLFLQDINRGRDCVYMGAGAVWKLYFLLSFAVNLKLL